MCWTTISDDHRRMGCSTSICQESEEYKQDAWERLRRKKGGAKSPVGSCSMSHQVVRICQDDKEHDIEQCSIVSGFHLQFTLKRWLLLTVQGVLIIILPSPTTKSSRKSVNPVTFWRTVVWRGISKHLCFKNYALYPINPPRIQPGKVTSWSAGKVPAWCLQWMCQRGVGDGWGIFADCCKIRLRWRLKQSRILKIGWYQTDCELSIGVEANPLRSQRVVYQQ